MALLDLASHPTPSFSCTYLIVALDRVNISETQQKQLTRALGWVGFGLVSLGTWLAGSDADVTSSMNGTSGTGVRSEKWTFLGMEL